ncbi:MAG: hypothetical protein MUC76_12185, partial [Spirochaetes bacterium]|nr:hypothetical protein [Spirochaetota bacterium]
MKYRRSLIAALFSFVFGTGVSAADTTFPLDPGAGREVVELYPYANGYLAVIMPPGKAGIKQDEEVRTHEKTYGPFLGVSVVMLS